MIKIPKKVYDAMIEHARAGYPNEVCGILGGDLKECKAAEFFPMKNLDESSISYFMDPKEQLLVLKAMRPKGIEMIGIFHSHVASAAVPSQKDARLAFYDEASYLIVSLSDLKKPVLRSFKIKDEEVSEESIEII